MRAWATPGARIADAVEPDYRQDSREMILDSFDFIAEVVADNYVWLRDTCVSQGVDVPIYADLSPITHYLNPRLVDGIVDSAWTGAYLPNLLPRQSSLAASCHIRLQRALTKFAWAAEFMGSVATGREAIFGRLSDHHQQYLTELSLLLGRRGVCFYMFVERDDVQDAPISAIGKARPRLQQIEAGITLASEVCPDRQMCDVGLLWSLDHHRLTMADTFRTGGFWTAWSSKSRPRKSRLTGGRCSPSCTIRTGTSRLCRWTATRRRRPCSA
jgi:hypothetical protein